MNQGKRDLISKVKSNTDDETGKESSLDKVITKEFIKGVNSGKAERDPKVGRKRTENVDKIAEITDTTLEKLVEETNKVRFRRLERQAVKDKEPKVLPPEYRRFGNNLSTELALSSTPGKPWVQILSGK